MKISHIEHLGIAVESIEEALPYYEQVLGLKCYNIETVEDQKVRTAFIKVGDVKLELLEPTSPESTIAKYLEKKAEYSVFRGLCLKRLVLLHLTVGNVFSVSLQDKRMTCHLII